MKLVYKLLLEMMVLGTVVLTVDGVDYDQGVFSFVVGGLLFGLLMYSIDPILGFFKFPKNFWGYMIIGTFFSILFFLILNSFIVGILNFGVAVLGGAFGPMTFPTFNLETQTLTVIFTALYASLLSLLMNQLGKSK